MLSVRRPGQLGAGVKLLLAGIGVVSPAGAFPITNPARVPIAVWLCLFSLTCVALLPGLWKSFRNPDWQPEVWPEDSAKVARVKRLELLIRMIGLGFFVASVFFIGHWHPHRVNWQMAVSTPGYFSLVWGPLVAEYRKRRETVKPPDLKPGLTSALLGAAPIQSEHWGGRTI